MLEALTFSESVLSLHLIHVNSPVYLSYFPNTLYSEFSHLSAIKQQALIFMY